MSAADMEAPMSMWQYQIGDCDVWQLAHLCNHMAGYGWEPLTVTDGMPGQKVSREVAHEDGPLYEALKPVVVLFRRPADWSEE